MKKIKSALVSVFSKEGLEPIIRQLDKCGVKLYSTGGTMDFIKGLGIDALPVEGLTGYPSILGGRVKTLHPAVFGGILGRRDNPQDVSQMKEYGIPEIDLVIVDLYPFRETVASGADHQQIIEKIDIGGISLIRAAAKNYKDTVIVPSVREYAPLLELLERQECSTTEEQRRGFAARAFLVSSGYDTEIFNYFNRAEGIDACRIAYDEATPLRYGENPHQKAAFYGDLGQVFEQLHGKDISYNNMLDIDAALNLMDDLGGEVPAFAILKHNNACGVALRPTLLQAWEAALSCDPVSAFGGVLICNREVDTDTAQEVNKLFFEVIVAPGYSTEALEILQSKKNRIILALKDKERGGRQVRSLLGGVAAQERDTRIGGRDTEMTVATKKGVDEAKRRELLFANILVKHAKSNAIVLAKDNMLLASGVGQTSRVDSLRQAIEKAKNFGFDLRGAVMASDAFFPFNDCVAIAHEQGIEYVIQPGGSVRDQDSIEYCDANGMAMVFTGMRHFRH